MKALRILISTALALVGALFLAITLTVPVIAATAPAILMIACGLLAWFAWPRQKKVVA